MPKVSIIIPYLDYPFYLEQCLASLEKQTFQDFEVLLMMDKHAQVVEVPDFVKVVYSGLSTVASLRYEGIKRAQGEYVYFLDSDDYLLPNTLETLFSLSQRPDILIGGLAYTWNKLENFIEKRENKEIDPQEQLEKEAASQENLRLYYDFVKEESPATMAMYYLLRAKKSIGAVTVLGSAYRREWLLGLDLVTDCTLFSDFVWVSECLAHVNTAIRLPEALYVKRRHNDPIHYPSLSQKEDPLRFELRIQAWQQARQSSQHQPFLTLFIDRKMMGYFLNTMVKRLRRSEDPIWRKVYFPLLAELSQNFDEQAILSLKGHSQRLIRALQKQDLKQVDRLTRWRFAWRKLKRMASNPNVAYLLAYYHRFLKQPLLEKTILFETFMAKNYSDSPKYIYEYIAQHYPDYTCVWAINDRKTLPYGAKCVKRFSFRYAYYLARSKYLVFNVRPPLWFRKREGQRLLQTWHGTPLKRLVFDQEEVTSASPKYKQQFYQSRQDWDYLISANPFSTETFRRCFMFENEMLEVGYPRNDILYRENKQELAAEIRARLGIGQDKKTILYAPTWRDDQAFEKGKYHFQLALDLDLLRKHLSDDYVILLRTHHYIADAIDTSAYEGFVYNVCRYDDISELYLISDICITDYSSVFFDFANLRRPILFFTYDIEKYQNQLRGFYIDMYQDLPGPLLMTNEEVVDAIEHIDQISEQYKERYELFYEHFCCFDDGHASQKAAEALLSC